MEANDGKATGAISLAGKPHSAGLSLSDKTLTALRNKYGELEPRWIERFGFGFDGPTESEGRYLLSAENADTIRNRMAETASEGGS